jgi:hypothetical protein
LHLLCARRSPVAGFIFFEPGVKLKPVKSNTPRHHRDFGQQWANSRIEIVLVYAKITGRVA